MLATLSELLKYDQWLLSGPDIGVLVGYFVLMLIVGYVCRNIAGDISDYIRMGCKGTWWLAGLSVFMQTFSTLTFTGICGQAFLAGWSVLLIFWGNALMFFLQAAFFAPWLRQTRAITPPDAIRQRFGPVMEQLFVYLGLPGGLCWSGMFLLSLATFFASMFGLPIVPTILVMAVVIIFYSVSGGSWSVQITDSLQSFILMPITIAIAGLCLVKLGDGHGMTAGFDNMMGMIRDKGLYDDFAIIKPEGFKYPEHIGKNIGAGLFTGMWVLATIFNHFLGSANMTTCYRYLSIKNGNEARKAALLAGVLMICGSMVWFIPPVTARLLYEDEVMALGTDAGVAEVSAAEAEATAPEAAGLASPATDDGEVKPVATTKEGERAVLVAEKLKAPADGAYAFIARKVLPPGMLGLVLIAMTSAAMSSMDSNLTGTAGLVTNNIYPPLMRVLGFVPWTGKKLLGLTKLVNLCLGAWATFMAFVFFGLSGKGGMFEVMLNIAVFIGAPLGSPMVVSFFVRRIPWWGPLAGMISGYITTAVLMVGPGKEWFPAPAWHWKVFIMSGVTIIPTLMTRAFWFTASQSYRQQVDKFFVQFRTPIDFETEVGQEADGAQMLLVGRFALIIGALLMILIAFGSTTAERLAAAFVALVVFSLGLLLFITGKRRNAMMAETVQVEDETSESTPE